MHRTIAVTFSAMLLIGSTSAGFAQGDWTRRARRWGRGDARHRDCAKRWHRWGRGDARHRHCAKHWHW